MSPKSKMRGRFTKLMVGCAVVLCICPFVLFFLGGGTETLERGRERSTQTAVFLGTVTVEPEQVINTTKGNIPVPGLAVLDGVDLEAVIPTTVENINIWNDVPRQSIVCQLPHETPIMILSAVYEDSEERYYFELESGNCQGWVSAPFVKAKDN